jgi:nicotinamidase-related amidase
MPSRQQKTGDLHGNVPDNAPVALMLVDVLNDLDFPGNEGLVKQAARLGQTIAALKQRCQKARIPAIYINDNRNRWRSDFKAVIAECCEPDSQGWPLVEPLMPASHDYILLKPKHSAFYATPLDTILSYLKTRVVILTGLTTAACILLTAGEIYVRDLKLYVPRDCVAGLNEKEHRNALALMRGSFGAITTPAHRLNLGKVRTRGSVR